MTPQEWYLAVSALGFFGTAWVATKRMLWVRAVGYTAVAILMTWYHFCQETGDCSPSEAQIKLDHIAGLWLSTSTLLLFGHFRYQLAEIGYQLLCLAGAVALVVVEQETSLLWGSLYVAGITLPGIGITWCLRGLPAVRLPWTIAGTVLGLVAVTLFFVQETAHSGPMIHGTFHITAALAAAFLCYGLRDPNLHENYHVWKDLLIN